MFYIIIKNISVTYCVVIAVKCAHKSKKVSNRIPTVAVKINIGY